ncbi:MAG: transposase [Candidatus Omnitrophica bacterium]|nr:transposase [Candidatus Omnitrophota bacterium]
MIRPRRFYYAKSIYHVIARGNNRQKILKYPTDKQSFLNSLTKYKGLFSFRLYAFVIMDNHIHLMIEADEHFNISKVMQRILLSYSAKYRRKYKYVGHVWQGRFVSFNVSGDHYVEECLQYIHRNPVKAGIVDVEADYRWSSARFYVKRKVVSDGLLYDLDLDGSEGHF